MQATDAIRTAEKIQLSNPLHIPKTLVDRFARNVTGIEKKGSGKQTAASPDYLAFQPCSPSAEVR